jgi:DNA helicase II / ATP-dependent DNA helicase PcrA
MSKVQFNTQQQKAINAHKGNYGVIASAGSGKSTVLLNRVKNLIETHNVSERDILTISFTRNTADELKKKLNKMGFMDVNVGTFHSICGRILSQEGVYINGSNLVKEWQVENCFKSIDDKPDVDDIKSFISYQKNYMRGCNDEFVSKDSNYTEDDLRQFYTAYEKFKTKNNLYDFDDYLLLCLDVLRKNKGKYTYEFILVDEHQDSNKIQHELLKELCQSGNLWACYDYRQAIYKFRGGNPDYCMNFEKDWDNATIINMDTNYRSTKNIIDNANRFIRKYYGNYEYYSDAIANNPNNGQIILNSYDNEESEAKAVADKIEELISNGEHLGEIAVLYRVNAQSIHIENEMKDRKIDYDISGDSSFFKRKEIAGILSYLRLIQNPHDDMAFESIFNLRNYPLTYFSGQLFNETKRFAGLNNLSLYEAFITMNFPKPWQKKNANIFEKNIERLRLQKDKFVSVGMLIDNIIKVFQFEDFIKSKYTNIDERKDRIKSLSILKSFVKNNNLEQFITYVYSGNTKRKAKKNSVKLMSLHASKGLEFNHCFLIGVVDGKFPNERADLLEESRLFYVGVTRSKENLHISEIGKGNQFMREYFEGGMIK